MNKRLLRKFVISLFKILDRYPRLKKWLIMIGTMIWRVWWKLRSHLTDKTVDWDKTFFINPNMIIRTVPIRIRIWRDKGKVINGDWDLPEKGGGEGRKFEDTDVYQACYQRFKKRKKWEETEYYKRYLNDIESGQTLRGSRSRNELNDRFQRWDLLYQNIRDSGYKTQRELVNSKYSTEEDEITISIARNGELLYTNGCHRLAIAKILDIKEVAVKVTVRHSEWIRFRNQINAYPKDQKTGEIYQPLHHPDLSDIPLFYTDDSFDIIKQNLTTKTGTVLDIGSRWGYFCHKFEDEGFNCYAVESDPTNFYFLNRLRQAENKMFKVFYGSIFDFKDRNDFDVVLSLNVFHHFLKTQSSYLELIELLKRLRMRELFFYTARRDEPQMENACKNYSNDEFIAFILEHSCLSEANYMGKSQEGKLLYKLYR